jgi:HSP20 family molecular chaperone IbpA
MTNDLQMENESLVYPGQYVPLQKDRNIMGDGKTSAAGIGQLSEKLHEFEDYFKLEIHLPFAKKEDLVVYSQEGILSVAFAQNYDAMPERNRTKNRVLIKHIALPENAGIEFVRAEYKNKVLNFYIPKTTNPLKSYSQQIIIY